MTSVGATQGVPETSADFSSGGFSNYFGIPDYQSSAVNGYLSALGSTNQGLFNASGRAFPDVSTQGVNFETVVGGSVSGASGTSAASPTFASIISLINDRLIAAGKSPLGFLNPFLYSTAASSFNDITTGSNPGCNTNGFPATAGWDPVRHILSSTPYFFLIHCSLGHWSRYSQLPCFVGCCRIVGGSGKEDDFLRQNMYNFSNDFNEM